MPTTVIDHKLCANVQAVNEESLKKLNEYINHLHGKRQVHPLTLMFYLRTPNSSSTAHGKLKVVNSEVIFLAIFIER